MPEPINQKQKKASQKNGSALKVLSDEGEEFNFDRLFEDAASFTNPNLKGEEIKYPRGATISKRSPLIKELFTNAR